MTGQAIVDTTTPDWTRAACVEVEPELFFPPGTTNALARSQTKAAKEVCAGCDIRLTCLEWAMSTRQEFGVWGGLSEDERHELRRKGKNAERQRRREREKARTQ
jgi:WhiB family redox-sensing transcriptional regulator